MKNYIVELKFVKFIQIDLKSDNEDDAIEQAKELAECDADMCDLDTIRCIEI